MAVTLSLVNNQNTSTTNINKSFIKISEPDINTTDQKRR